MKAQSLRRGVLFLSFLLLPITLNYFSPVLIIMGGFEKVAGAAFFVWLLFFLTSLIFGRAACSYVCPYGGLQMISDKAIQKNLKYIKWLEKFRYLLGGIWLIGIIYPIITKGGFNRIDFFYNTTEYVSVSDRGRLIFYYVIVFALLIMPLTLGKRATCHYLCPMSILNIIGTKIKNKLKISSLNLVSNKNKCVKCNQCTKVCPMSLKVMDMVQKEEMDNIECILCGECVSACKVSAINRRFCKGGYNKVWEESLRIEKKEEKSF